MTSKMHWTFQILTLALHGLNLYSGTVPQRFQPVVAFALALVNAGLGLLNHYYAPDGTKIAG